MNRRITQTAESRKASGDGLVGDALKKWRCESKPGQDGNEKKTFLKSEILKVTNSYVKSWGYYF